MKNKILLVFLFAFMSFSLQAQTSQNLTLQTFISADEVLFLHANKEKVATYNLKQDFFAMEEYEIKNNVVYFKNDSIANLKGNKLILDGKEYKFKTKFLSFKKANVIAENNTLLAIKRTEDRLTIDNFLKSSSQKNEILKAWVIYHSYNWAKKKETSQDTWVLGVAGGVAASVAAAFL
ncbi:hypothetical protein [Mesonia maritima]|uniref:Secreted protein n=1 Tax=Mesonia maritima TaxID=1793873 RepID=A0ABU1K6P5_9FLAO|nr:hypothetical protein [Mesonia maritima]MDR6300687.1 hypothetical protein [Mesonia maritima]